ncbi:MAG: GNAT family N-acetyltransferase [Candidatus Nucleicultricaceae bacterium]
MPNREKTDISVHAMHKADISKIVRAFEEANWPKSHSLFEDYLKEQETGERYVWIARYLDQFAGYVTLKRISLYQHFSNQHIPEIADLNVLPNYRNLGIGACLLNTAEQKARDHTNRVGIGVGLYGGHDGGYGAAQRLYVKRGYIPDGKGVTYAYHQAAPYRQYQLDDDLILWFIKTLD